MLSPLYDNIQSIVINNMTANSEC